MSAAGALILIELRENTGHAAAGPVGDDAQPRPRRLDRRVVRRDRRGGRDGLDCFGWFRFETGVSNSMAPPVSRLELVLLEQADDAVFAVIAGLADDMAAAQARDRFGEDRRAGMGDVLGRHRLQDRELGPSLAIAWS
jgi:hypothetical protein